MRLNQKLGWWFGLVAIGVFAVSSVWVRYARVIQQRFDTFANLTTPSLVALGQIRALSLEMLAELYATIASRPASAASPLPAEEAAVPPETQFEETGRRLKEWLAILRGVRAASAHPQLLREADEVSTRLWERARALLAQARAGPALDEGEPQWRRLRQAERRFVRVVEQAMAAEVGRLKRERALVSQSIGSAIRLSGVAAGAIVALAVALGALIAGTIARPVIRLSRDVATVGAGELSHRTAVRSSDEIGALAAAVNRMAENLQRTTVSKRYVDNIIGSMVDMLIVTDPAGLIQRVNPATLRTLGYAEPELLGQPMEQLVAEGPGELAGDGTLARRILVQGPVLNQEAACLAKDGRRIPVLFSGSVMQDARGQQEGLVCVALDITERKRAEEALRQAYAELQRAQQQLVQSEKLAALGRFAAGVAHEVKNPLGIILGGTEFLRTQLASAEEDVKTSLAIIERSVHRADTIVRDLLKFASPSPLQKEPVTPEALIQGTLDLLAYSGALKEVEVATQFGHGPAMLTVDKNQLQQVLLNLLMNAVEAMPGGGTLALRTTTATLDGAPACAVEVTDTGNGMAPEQLARLFEPFFTTKRERKGTGLGLSISKTIVESHGGTLTFRSTVGRGTTATVTLPANTGGGGA